MRRSALLFAFACLLGPAGCELVLGDLPPAKQHRDAGPGGGGAGGATTTTTTSAGTGTTTSSTGGTGGSGGSGGATTTHSTSHTGGTSTGTGGQGGCCDCDGDNVLAQGICGGTDCDDHDDKTYPGEPVYYGVPHPDPAIGFDWDCSGQADPNPALMKTVQCGLIGLPCAADTGFLDTVPPPCGQSKPWGTCKQNGLGCAPLVVEPNKVMTCK